MRPYCLAPLLALAGARPRVGLAYTRNEIGANRTRAFLKRELRNVVLSAWSVRRRETVPVTLFTDLDAGTVHDVTRELLGWERGRRLFDRVLPDGLGAYVPRGAAERALLAASRPFGWGGGEDVVARRAQKLRSRLGRLLNLGRGPYDLTLFVDDDTFFCGQPRADRGKRTPLMTLLHRFASSKAYDVRAHVFGHDRREAAAMHAAKECV